ncbi:MAG TPA: zinc ribbon domain-containing protein [Gemmataceae bacterium]|nr:zinc ribbon domain-containing protein [Gemmataceae bacterium]
MPLYDYACQECDHTFEALVNRDEDVECPECHTRRVRRQLSLPAKPRVVNSSLPLRCDPKAPPCGPGCCRL